jgi:hypothetical protein
VTDTDLGEEDVVRLASAGGGSNKSSIIDTLTKSLILRNKYSSFFAMFFNIVLACLSLQYKAA